MSVSMEKIKELRGTFGTDLLADPEAETIDPIIKEIQTEATRQDRSLSWIVQKAWKIARREIMKFPSVNELPGADEDDGK